MPDAPPAPPVKSPHDELNDVMAAMRTLDEKGLHDADSQREFSELVVKGKSIRAQIEQKAELEGLESFAGRSQGGLPLAKPGEVKPESGDTKASFSALRESGAITVAGRDDFSVELQSAYGEGMYSEQNWNNTGKAFRAIVADDKYHDAFGQYMRAGVGGYGISADAMRVLQEGVDTQGGFLVPEDILNRVLSRLPTPTRIAPRTTTLQTGRDALTIPKVIYTTDDLYSTGMRITWTGEIPASSTAMRVTEPVFGQERIPIFTAMMSIPITNDMIEDSAFPLVEYVSGKFGETIDLLRDNMILNGLGGNQPTGILVNPGADVNQPKVITAASGSPAASFAAQDLVSVAMALPEQYDDNSVWVMNKVSTAATIASFTDSNGRFMWGAGLQDSGLEPGFRNKMLLGYPVVLSGFMPNTGASSYPIVFGDLSGYYLVNRIGFSIQVLRELYAETNQILILGRIRFGGALAEPWKLRALRAHA